MDEDIVKMIAFRKSGGTLAQHMALRKKAYDREISVSVGASFEEVYDKIMDLMNDTIPEYIDEDDGYYYLADDDEDISQLIREEVDTSKPGEYTIRYVAKYGYSEDDEPDYTDMDESLTVLIHVE